MVEEKIIALSKISPKGLVTIPRDVMEVLNLKHGDKILWYLKDREMCVKKV